MMNRLWTGLWGLLMISLLSACAAYPGGWADRAAQRFLAPEDELATVVAFYDNAAQLQELPSTVRVQEYRELDHALSEETPVRERLNLALLLSGIVEPELADHERARELLESSLTEAEGALLAGHVRFMLMVLDHAERQHGHVQAVRRELAAERRQSESLRARVREMEAESKTLETEIETLETEIETLEAKIQALAFIEQSLKERGQIE